MSVTPQSPRPTPSLKRGMLTGGVWILFGKSLTVLCTLVTEALLSRILDRDQYGVYVIAFSLLSFASITATLGLHHTVLRFVAEALGIDKPARARAAITKVYRWAFVSCVVTMGLLALGPGAFLARRVWDAPELAGSMGALAVWAVLISFQTITSESFRGFKDLRFAALFGGVVTGLLNVAFLTLIFLGWGHTTIGVVLRVAVIAATLSLGLGTFVLYRTKVRPLPRDPDAITNRELFAVTLPLWVVMFVNNFVLNADRWILGAFAGKEDVAIYGAAARLVLLVSQPLILINLLVPPYIAELYAKGETLRLERILRQTAALAGLPALVVLFLFIFFGGPVLGTVYPAAFAAGAPILAVLSVAKTINVLTGSAGITMAMTGHQNVMMRISVVAGVLSVAGCYFAAQRWGALGVAVAASGGPTLNFLAVWLATKKYTGMWTHPSLPSLGEIRDLIGHLRRR